jgi:glycosyltransferase involved in cell wall biosynthesis
MRIAMLCSNHVVTDARVTHKQAASLAAMGHRVRVFGMESAVPFDVPGVEHEVVSRLRIGIRARAAVARRLCGPVLRWKPDVMTCHEPETAALGLGLRPRLGARVIFDVHELWHETMAARAPAPLRGVARRAFADALKTIARRCDWVTVVSPWNLAFYRAARHDGRVTLIHNSPRIEWFPPCRQHEGGPLVLVHEGSLDEGRGMLEILAALDEARRRVDLRWLVIGGVRPRARDLFDRTVRERGLAGAVEPSGWVPYRDVGRLLARSQIGIVAMQPSPNNYLSLSNKLYNYMACGMPVIVPQGSASADLVRAAGSGVAVDTTDPHAIAEALLMLAQDRALREEMGAAGRRAILETYGWHRMEERLRCIYAAIEREGRRA